jgi:hypothetical protein
MLFNSVLLLNFTKTTAMEYGLAWVLSVIVAFIGILTKILMETFIPKNYGGNESLKSSYINAAMIIFILIMISTLAIRIFSNPWNQELLMLTLFKAFLLIGFVAFLVVIKIFKIYIQMLINEFEDESDE